MPFEYNPDSLREAESDIRERLAGHQVDLEVQRTISNLYRAATVVSRSAEREFLREEKLSWSAFVVLWVLWIWGEMDSSRLAGEVGLTLGTLTGVRKTLEARGLVDRSEDPTDGRVVNVGLTAAGTTMLEALLPKFNEWSANRFGGLAEGQQSQLAELLESIIVHQPKTEQR